MSVPTKPKTAEQRLEALARSASNVTLLKYNSGNWSVSEIPVPASTRFVLYPDQTSHAWTHFAEGKVVAEISAIVADDEDGDTELRVVRGKGRKNLGFDDETKWEADAAGKRRDPWSYGFAMPLMNAETGAIVAFKVASVGGMGAIAEQVGSFNRNKHLGYPIVTLSTRSYKNKKYGGFTSYPVFINVGYDTPPTPVLASRGGNGGDGARVVGASKASDDGVIVSEHAVRYDRDVDDVDSPF